MARGSRRYLQHSLAGQASPVGPEVLGQDHGAGPHVHPVLRVQHLKSTGCGAGVGGGGLPVLPPRFPPAPAGRYLGDAQRQRRRPLREAVPPHAAPPPPPPRLPHGRAAAQWRAATCGTRPRGPIGAFSGRGVRRSAAAGADGGRPVAQSGACPGAPSGFP